jgi:hypothetical protein
VHKLLAVFIFKTLKDTVFIYPASEAASMDFEADFGDLAGYMHLKFLPPTFKVFCTISRISLREVFVHISVFLGLIVHNDDVFRARNANSFAHNILNIFGTIKLAVQLTAEEMVYPIASNLSAGTISVEELGDDRNGIISGICSHNEYAPLLM